MRVAVGGERAVPLRCLAEPETVADPSIGVGQAGDDVGRLAAIDGRAVDLLHGEQQLGDHVPVDRPDPLVAVHRSGATGERRMVEELLVQLLDHRPLCGVGVDAGQHLRQHRAVGERRPEVESAVPVDGEHRPPPLVERRSQERCPLDLVRRERVRVEEGGSHPLRVEHERVLVGSVDVGLEQRIDDCQRRPTVERPRRQHGHLPLEHRAEVVDRSLADAAERDPVVRVVQPVGPTRRPQRRFEMGLRSSAEAPHLVGREVVDLAGDAGGEPGAVVGADRPERVDELPATAGVDDAGVVVSFERGGDLAQPADDEWRHGERPRTAGSSYGEPVEERDVPDEVRERHHREPVACQRIVGVVPLRALRVHPDPATGHERRQLGERRDEQLLQHPGPGQVAAGRHEYSPVGADRRLAGGDLGGPLDVERDRVAGVAHHLVVVVDQVGHVGEDEVAPVEPWVERIGLEALPRLEQPEQVDDLVVAPVPDVAPRVVRVGDLPVDAGAGDAVGVVAVGGRGVEELGDDVREPGRVRLQQRLPVLEDVSPVALVGEQLPADVVPDVDREPVPRPARVAVPAGERQGQVLEHQPDEIGVARRIGELADVAELGPLAERRQRLGVTIAAGPVANAEEVEQVGDRDPGAVGEDAAAHRVEQDVGQVVGVGDRVGRVLEPVGVGQHRAQAVAPGLDVVRQSPADALLVDVVEAVDHLGVVEVGVGDDRPGRRPSCADRDRAVQQVGAGQAGEERRGSGRSSGEHVVDGPLVEERPSRREACRPHHGRGERLARFGAVGHEGLQRVDGCGSPRPGLGALVRVDEVGAGQLGGGLDAGGHHVEEPVEHVELGEPVAGDLDGARPAVCTRRRPGCGERQPPALIVLLEGQHVAEDSLGDRPGALGWADGLERAPELATRGGGTGDERHGAGVTGGAVQPIVGEVGEDRPVGVDPPRSQRPVARDEHPEVGVGHDRREERFHPLDVIDPVGVGRPEPDQPTRRPGIGGARRHRRDDTVRRSVRRQAPDRTFPPISSGICQTVPMMAS